MEKEIILTQEQIDETKESEKRIKEDNGEIIPENPPKNKTVLN